MASRSRASVKDAAAAPDRLTTYRKKRDFTLTPEPAGTVAPELDGHRFVVQRHRARRLHYDLRLEADGVLMSWAVPKGPTLDPDAKRMAIHVEDHPLEYFDFEGVIPSGEYGGGDVIVWDWGTWELTKGSDPIAAAEAGDLHFDLHGHKLAGHFALVRRGGRGGDDSGKDNEWLLIHQHDEHAEKGWDAEQHPRSVKSGRTNDEVKQAPAATWSSNAIWAAANADELAALDALGTKGTWSLGGQTLQLTNLDKVLFPGSRGSAAVTKRELIGYHATIAPAMLPYLADRPVNLHRFPDGIDKAGFWHKAVPKHAPEWLRRWRNADADPDQAQEYLVLDSAAALAWAANYGAVEIHPWISTAATPHEPTWAMIDIDPGEAASFDDVVTIARLHHVALDHVGVQSMPKVTGKRGIQVWVPVASGLGYDDTRDWVESLSRLVGAVVPDLVSWEWKVTQRGGRSRLDFTQNAIGKTLVAPFSLRPAKGAPVSVPIAWAELEDPELRPDRWTIHNVHERLAAAGDPLAALIGLQQRLPRL